MNRERAREILESACVLDMIDSSMNSYVTRRDIARDGFVGFAKMSDADLAMATADAGLQEDDDLVNEAFEELRGRA